MTHVTADDVSNTGIRLLIAEDDDDDFLIFSIALQECGIRIKPERVENGKNLLQSLDKDLPDVVFMDVVMPLKDGRECLSEIRSSNRYDNLPVIMYTSLDQLSVIDYCFNQRCNLYVIKPNTISKLSKMLTDILRFDWKKAVHYPERSAFVIRSDSDLN